jgi:ABC-type sugar transport system ATPase subunit
MARITLEKLRKHYGKVKAVDDVDFEIGDEEFVVFLGPSGCGKTTTLRCIAGLEGVTSGNIYFDGKRVNELPPADRNIAMVFQFYALYPHLNAYRNIVFPLKAEKMPSPEIKKKVSWVSELLRIESILGRKMSELPDGDKQKVALARAIVRSPQVLLLDEPLSALDEKFREQMRVEFLKIQKALSVTTVYVTHDQREAMTLADRIVVMKDGKIIEAGEPEKLYETPQNLFTGYFIGSPGMNFIDCTCGAAGAASAAGGLPLRLSSALQKKLRDFRVEKFIFGIRPEYLFFRKKAEKTGNGLAVRLVNVETIQQMRYGNFYIGEKLYKCVVEDGLAAGKGKDLSGAEGYATVDDEKVRFYDPDSGKIL